jgi:hypothetical protein
LKPQQPITHDLAVAHVRAVERGKRAYKKADEHLKALLHEYEPGATFQVGKEIFVLKDNIAKGEVGCWHGSRFKRYELEPVIKRRKK